MDGPALAGGEDRDHAGHDDSSENDALQLSQSEDVLFGAPSHSIEEWVYGKTPRGGGVVVPTVEGVEDAGMAEEDSFLAEFLREEARIQAQDADLVASGSELRGNDANVVGDDDSGGEEVDYDRLARIVRIQAAKKAERKMKSRRKLTSGSRAKGGASGHGAHASSVDLEWAPERGRNQPHLRAEILGQSRALSPGERHGVPRRQSRRHARRNVRPQIVPTPIPDLCAPSARARGALLV